MSALLELAARCEAATGPDREIMAAAYAGIHGHSWAVAAYRHGSLGAYPDADKQQAAMRFGELILHQAWLDAAMSLVPEGMDWRLGRTNGGLTIHAEVGGSTDEHMRFAATPALALCAAALRARAALETGDAS